MRYDSAPSATPPFRDGMRLPGSRMVCVFARSGVATHVVRHYDVPVIST